MKRTRLLILPVVLVCLVSAMSFAAGRTRAERWKTPHGTREILMNHREAQGLGDYGHEKFKGMSAIRVTRKVTRSGSVSYNTACEAKDPDRIRTESGNGQVAINTASLRIETDNSGTVNRRTPERSNDSVIAMCLITPSKSATSEKVRMVGKERVGGKMAYHMLAIDDVGQYDEWIDATNYTLVQRKQSGVILNTTEEWSDFRNVSGVMVPFDHFTRNTSTLNPWTEDEALTKMDFDPQINDADFSADATKPTMTTGSATSGSTSGTQAPGSVITGNIGGQNVSVNVNDALAALTGRPTTTQTQTSSSTSTPSTSTTTSTTTPAAESQSGTSSNAQTAVANQVAQAAKDPNATMTAAQTAAANKQVPSSLPGTAGPSVVRQIGHGQIISPACSDATNLIAVDEVSTGYKDPSADMRFTVTNTGSDELYVDLVNCKEVSRMKTRDSKRCIYASKAGWVVVVAKSKDVVNAQGGSAGGNACGEGFNALTTMQESKVGSAK